MEPKMSKYLHAKGRALGLPIGGTFELTPRCNFNCKMCYVHLTAQEQKARGEELTARRWLDLAQKARDAGTVFLLLTGGEATIRPDFPEIYRELQKMGFILSLNSNGFLLDGDLRRLLIDAPPTRVNISLYGMSNEVYERLCGVAAYDRVIANVRALRQAGVDVRLTMSVTPDNFGDMERVTQTAKEIGAKIIAGAYMFPPLRAHPERVGENFRFCAEEAGQLSAKYDKLRFDPEIFSRRIEALRNGLGIPTEDDEDCDLTAVGEKVNCRAGSTTFWASWDGLLLPCGQMPEPAVKIENGDFLSAWQKLREKTAELRLPKECSDCRIRHACQICAAKCLCETGRTDRKPEYLCRMTRAYLAELLGEKETKI